MKKVPEIKKDLSKGDHKVIHLMTGVPLATINALLQGVRNINTPSGAIVLKAAKQIIKARHDLIHQKPPARQPERTAFPLFSGE